MTSEKNIHDSCVSDTECDTMQYAFNTYIILTAIFEVNLSYPVSPLIISL